MILPEDKFEERLRAVLTTDSCRVRADRQKNVSIYSCSMECAICIFSMQNRACPDKMVQLCVDGGLITKAEALKLLLDSIRTSN